MNWAKTWYSRGFTKVLTQALALGLFCFALVWVGGGLLSADYVVSVQARLPQTPERVWRELTTLQTWQAWHPDQRSDPTFRGACHGEGCRIYAWQSISLGDGEIRILSADSATGRFCYRHRLPNGQCLDGQLTVRPLANGSSVTWQIRGTAASHLARWAGLAATAIWAPRLQQGLADLQLRAELPEAR